MKSQNVNNPEFDAPAASSSTRTTTSADTREGAAPTSSGKKLTSATAASSSLSSSSILPRMSDPAPISASNSASPQPMEKPAAAGPQAASKDSAGGIASPYGTRSRNRTGASRPNYAEDKDIDMDLFDPYRDDEAKKAAARQFSLTNATTATPAATQRSGGAASRKPLPSADDPKHQGSAPYAPPKESHHSSSRRDSPAASSSTASGAANGTAKSKKRKVDAVSTASGSQTPSASHVSSAAATKRQGAGSHGGNGAGTTNGNHGTSSARDGGYGETNMLTFENCGARLKNGKMVADDGTVLEVNDHVYLVCEPPGEPYYLGRIMEFLHVKNDAAKPIDALRINWYYRPKDIGRKVQDTRLVFATMHSDISPLTSLRGKCQIRHKAEIPDMAAYKRAPDSFWYEKLYDRYIQKNYEVIPTTQIINVPEHVKKVLDERWKYILVEQGRGKELTSAVKTCKRCTGYCASNDSVDCAMCDQTYHMNCVKPPLLKKPSRGFAWSCAACSRAQERKLEARNTPNVLDGGHDHDDDEFLDDDDDDAGPGGVDTGRTSRTSPGGEEAHAPATAEQIYHASLWPYRYLGIHCKVEDALDYDDRIFPRASTRLGPRHQATVLPWPGRPVKYVKPPEIKKSGRNNGKVSKEVQAAIDAEREKRPKWVQDEPAGWVQRGGDDTVTLLYRPPEDCGVQMSGEDVDKYMDTARTMAVSLGLPPRSTNLQDVARDVLFLNQFDPQKSLKELEKVPKTNFGEPELTPAELKKFEEGVAKYGSELHSVMKHVKTLKPATVVRFYYTWKKSERGKQIWGNYSGRKGKKDAKKAEAAANKMADDVANDHDDSAFDAEKAREKKKSFICKFCSTKSSRQWRRAPNASATLVSETGGRNSNKDKNGQYIQALCRRCAELWRRYAIQWEDVDEVAKKVAQTGGRGWRRKVDEELYKELLAADEMMSNTRFSTPDLAATTSPAPSLSSQQQAGQEPSRKKLKGFAERDPDQTASESGSISGAPHSKKKAVERPAPPPVPEVSKPRTLPCAICHQLEPLGDQHLSCKECRLAVHRNCYGIVDNRGPGKWTCDMCLNDKNPQVSLDYKCALCPVEYTEHDFVEPPKVSHKKKTEKDRERERVEREAAQKAAEYYRKKQLDAHRPVNPREPLKRTADNNWVHVTCAVWTPEVKFGNAKALGPSEGIPLIPQARYDEICKVCKKGGGACVSCPACKVPVHVECAHQGGYVLGFDITPVKGSRRDQFNIVSIHGESGTMSAAVWCKDHVPKTTIHPMHDVVDEDGLNALQLYVQNYKQADLALTGCARKAGQITVASKMSASTSPPAAVLHRRPSTVAMMNGDDKEPPSPTALRPGGKVCLTCNSDVSPVWHPIDHTQERELTNGYYGNLGMEAQKFVEQRSFQCHKCKRLGRQPKPHVRTPKEPTPAPEPVRQVSQPPVAPINPPPTTMGPAEPRHNSLGPYGVWSPRAPAVSVLPPAVQPPPLQAAVQPPSLQTGVQPPPLQAPAPGPVAAPLMPPASQGPPVAPPPLPLSMTRAPPIQPPAQYGPPSRSYDWHPRPSTGHGPPPAHNGREINGGPSPPPMGGMAMPPLAPPNHLRPPPLNHASHGPPPPPPNHNGHISQPPYVNGLPPSPQRMNGPPPLQNGGSPYMHHGHGPVELRPHSHMNAMPPGMSGNPPPSDTRHPMGNLLRQSWPGHMGAPHHQPPHHTSPPPVRESHPPLRESSNPPPRDRPSNGASSSTSLRYLLN